MKKNLFAFKMFSPFKGLIVNIIWGSRNELDTTEAT